MKKSKINNAFPTTLDERSLSKWFENEISMLSSAESDVLKGIFGNMQNFINFPGYGQLFFSGFVRKSPKSEQYIYPTGTFFSKMNSKGKMETMTNGPAVVAFESAGGQIPLKGNGKGWSIHHLYSGDFPYIGKRQTLHAVKDGEHFTHSAGLVAVHPLADAAAHEYACFSWLLRANSYLLFGYDPDRVFQ